MKQSSHKKVIPFALVTTITFTMFTGVTAGVTDVPANLGTSDTLPAITQTDTLGPSKSTFVVGDTFNYPVTGGSVELEILTEPTDTQTGTVAILGYSDSFNSSRDSMLIFAGESEDVKIVPKSGLNVGNHSTALTLYNVGRLGLSVEITGIELAVSSATIPSYSVSIAENKTLKDLSLAVLLPVITATQSLALLVEKHQTPH